MKAFLFALLIVGTVLGSEVQYDPLNNVMEAINGFFGSLNKKSDVNNVCLCLNKIPVLVNKVEKFIEDFRTMEWKEFEKIMDLFIDFFSTLKETYGGLKPCLKVPNDFVHLFEIIGHIDINKLYSRILKYSFQIFSWITDAMKDFNEKQYGSFGEKIGRIVYTFLLEDSAEF